MDEITEEFLIESREALDQLDRDLVSLEASSDDPALLARIFRALHTIKGTCGFLGFSKLEKVSHAGEGLLSKLRDGKATTTPEIATALLSTVDAIRAMVDVIQTSGADGENDYVDLVAQLHQLAEGDAKPGPPKAAAEVAVAPRGDGASDAPAVAEKPRRRRARKKPTAGAITTARSAAPPLVLVPAPEVVPPPPAAEVPVRPLDAQPPAPAQADTVRVDVHLLDRLMDLAGELVLTRNQIREIQQGLESGPLAAAAQRLNLVTAGLQEGIMLMRMQPVDFLFGKFPRMVRDTAKQCGKLARVELDGKNAELDRTLLEAIKDPLTHLIRNAVDHGIEAPEERLRRGKHAEGVVTVRAVHSSGHVTIEISDDGAGIPLDRVRDKAVAKGLLSQERARAMTDSEMTSLIFLPGLSTAQAVTSVSGRGVGMDVVKTNVERLGGTVEVETRLGAGTTFRLKLPLTLAIIPALIVEADGERYAIPQVQLQELVLIDRAKQKLETVCDAPVFRLRDRLLPVVFLNESLELAARGECLARGKVHLAVLQVNGLCFGLAVDRVIDQQEIVVKPLATQLEGIAIYSACTILGDGRVVLILDAAGIAQRMGVTRVQAVETAVAAVTNERAEQRPISSFLLIAGSTDTRLAIPLEDVTRLETVPTSRLERSAGAWVLQYESEIVPLVELSQLVPSQSSFQRLDEIRESVNGHVNVIVAARRDGAVGFVVEDVVDVVDLVLPPERAPNQVGVTNTLVIHDRVTDLLSLDWLIERAGMEPRELGRSA